MRVKSRASQPIRLTPIMAARELGVSSRALARKLVSNAILPGEDGMFSMRQIFGALNNSSSLERKAKETVWQRKIDEAEEAKMRRAELSGSLVPTAAVREWTTDIMTRVVSVIRHSKLSEQSKDQILHDLRERTVAQMTPKERRALVEQNKRREEAMSRADQIELEALRHVNKRLSPFERLHNNCTCHICQADHERVLAQYGADWEQCRCEICKHRRMGRETAERCICRLCQQRRKDRSAYYAALYQ